MYSTTVYRKNRGKKYSLLLFLIIFALILAGTYSYYHPDELLFFFARKNTYDKIIRDAAARHGIEPELIKAVVWQESRFDPNVKGDRGEVGLMQIRPEKGAVEEWRKTYGATIRCKGILFRPELNIEIGSWYLARAMKNWSGYKYQYELALSEYNAGRRGMRPWVPDSFDGKVIDKITISSTKKYVQSVMKQYRLYKGKNH